MLDCRFKKGFTLIELMISLVIITLLIGGSLVYINNSNMIQKSQGAEEELVSDLRLARNYAITNQIPKDFEGTLNYVKVTITNNGTKINVLVNENEGVYFSKEVSSGIKITMANELRFLPYQGKLISMDMLPVGVGDTPVFTIDSGIGAAGIKKVSVTTSGMVNESSNNQNGPYLSNLIVKSGMATLTLDPPFLSNTLDYFANTNGGLFCKVTPSTGSGAIIKVNGVEVANGQPSAVISLNTGDNNIKIEVGSTIYTLTVRR